eukprot:scaffold290004_cov21-Tisochrysis_lutea.AAC.1
MPYLRAPDVSAPFLAGDTAHIQAWKLRGSAARRLEHQAWSESPPVKMPVCLLIHEKEGVQLTI